MKIIPQCCLHAAIILALTPLGFPIAADPQASIVNERLPSSLADREQYWGINCSDVAQQTSLMLLGGNCPPAELTRQIRLCGFLYQPPGDTPLAACPRFATTWQMLDTRTGDSCASDDEYRQRLRWALTCAAGETPGEN